MKILACVVTYNRVALLERCVDGILAQDRPPDLLLVINNGSTDTTLETLERKGITAITQANVGSAGGWARAIEEAQQRGFDAVWLMDDDGFPAPPALGILERALHGDRACVSSVVLRENEPDRFVFPFPRLNANGWPTLLSAKRKIPRLSELRREAVDGLYPFAHFFNGALVSVAATRKVGNVSADYFLSGDEIDYFARLRRAGPVLSHVDAHHLHPDVSLRALTPIKTYYFLKNTLIVNRRFHDRLPARQAAAVLGILARLAARNSPAEAWSYLAGANAPLFWRAVRRGLAGRIGPDFDE